MVAWAMWGVRGAVGHVGYVGHVGVRPGNHRHISKITICDDSKTDTGKRPRAGRGADRLKAGPRVACTGNPAPRETSHRLDHALSPGKGTRYRGGPCRTRIACAAISRPLWHSAGPPRPTLKSFFGR